MHNLISQCCVVAEPIIAACYMDKVLTVIEKFLPTANSLQELDTKSIEDCLMFVCDFMWHYFTTVGSSLRLQSANSLMMELFRLDVLYEFDVTVAGRLKAAWQQGLTVAYTAGDSELGQHVDRMLAIVVASVGECSQVYRLSEIVSGLWHTAVAASSQPVDLGVVKQALSSGSSTLLQSPSLLALVLDRSLFVRSVNDFQPSTSAESFRNSRAVALVALTARFLLTTWKTTQPSSCDSETASYFANNDDDDDDDNDLTVAKSVANEGVNSLNLEMLNDIALAIVCIQAIQAYTCHPPPMQQELQQDFCQLIGRLSNAETEYLLRQTIQQSMADEIWSLVLEVILQQVKFSNKELIERNLLSDLEQFVPLTLSTVSTLCVFLPRMHRDTQQHVAEITVALLLSCDIDKIAAFDSEYVVKVIFSLYLIN